MRNYKFSDLVNIGYLKKMSENLYAAAGIPIGIIDVDGTIVIKTGWQDICTKFHRIHDQTRIRCSISNNYIINNLENKRYVEYKCLNNMWDIGVPIIIGYKYLATIFLGQFFYDDEIIDTEFFCRQAVEFGFNEEKYLEALNRVPKFSRKTVHHIIEYYIGLVNTLAESGLRQLEYENSQKELAKNQKYLSTIFNSVNDSILIFDFYGKILDVNQRTTSMFGYSNDELINMNVKDIISEKFNLNEVQFMQTFRKATTDNPIILECLCKTKSNHEFWTEINISAIKIANKEENIATIRDITDRKLNELALLKETQEMENLRTEFFANISHELKTPLNIIFGIIQIIQMEILNKDELINREKILSNLKVEKQNCFRLLRLINNLIDSTKLESGYFELNMVNCNIVNIVEEISLSVAEYINNNKLSLIFDTDIEEKIMACDLDKIERIMLNLLSNAVKFTPAGGNILVYMLDGKEYVTIIVEDNGIGIPSQKLDIIFDRFRQVDKSFARNHEGSGIGLSLVKSLVELQGGNVSVESKYGVGTKFIIKLPVKLLNDVYLKDNKEEMDNSIDSIVERIRIEFSDIYN